MFCNSAVTHELIFHHNWGKDFLISNAVSSHEQTLLQMNLYLILAARVSHNAMFSKKGQLWIMPCHSHIKFNNDCESDKKSLLVFFISREAAQTIVKAMKLMATRSQDCEIARNL